MRFFKHSSVCQSSDVLSDASVSHLDVWVDTESFELVSSVSETKNCFFFTAGQVHIFKSLKSYVIYQFQCKEREKDTYKHMHTLRMTLAVQSVVIKIPQLNICH